MVWKICRINEVMAARDCCRATVFNDVKRGLFPRPLKLNARANCWPESEVTAVNRAIIAGESEAAIRELVLRLEKARLQVANKA